MGSWSRTWAMEGVVVGEESGWPHEPGGTEWVRVVAGTREWGGMTNGPLFVQSMTADRQMFNELGDEVLYRRGVVDNLWAAIAHSYTPELPPRLARTLHLGRAMRSIRQRLRIRGGARIWPRRRHRMAGK